MAERVVADLLARVDWLAQTTVAGEVEQPSANGVLEFARHLANGSGNAQVEKRWYSRRQLAAGGNETLDLQALSYTALGITSTISFSKVRAIVVAMLTDLAGLRVGGTVANEWSAPWISAGQGQRVGPGSVAVIADLVDGWAVTAGAKGLLLTNASGVNAANFDIVVLGN